MDSTEAAGPLQEPKSPRAALAAFEVRAAAEAAAGLLRRACCGGARAATGIR